MNSPFSDSPEILSDAFLIPYSKGKIPPEFGYNGLGEFVYRRTYSRELGKGKSEEWWQTISRVVNETFRLLLVTGNENRKIEDFEDEAEEMFRMMYHMKFLPAGRGLWAMGSKITRKKKLYSALNNCAFVSTEYMASGKADYDFSTPFVFAMDMLMQGVGVGFDTKGSRSRLVITKPETNGVTTVRIKDSREGWVTSLGQLLDQYFPYSGLYRGANYQDVRLKLEFDYSLLRLEGEPLKCFGGSSAGPAPLIKLHTKLWELLDSNSGKEVSETLICDIMNLIGSAVVSGGIRRTAMIALGTDSDEFTQLKDYTKNPQRASYGWTSNNSVVVRDIKDTGLAEPDWEKISKGIYLNGEPGVFFLDNARKWGRTKDTSYMWKDFDAAGTNPCGEQTLESYELCNLVEVFPSKCADEFDFYNVLRMALLYGKLVSSLETKWHATRVVMKKNRRIGISLSGIPDFIEREGIVKFQEWCDQGYEVILEEEKNIEMKFGIGKSIKLTTVKPSGTLSLLAGVCAGMHYPIAEYVKRRVIVPERFRNLWEDAKKKGVHGYEDEGTKYLEFPIKYPFRVRKRTIWEQLCLVQLLQREWSDNQVSCTITFSPREVSYGQIMDFLKMCSTQCKSISLLPEYCGQPYKNMPFEEISEFEYERMTAWNRIIFAEGSLTPNYSDAEEEEEEEECFEEHSSLVLPETQFSETQFSQRDFCDGDDCK